jgi:ribosomal protein S12 methylthiotransferase
VKFAVVTLGCDKNTVDSERYVAALLAHGGLPVDALVEAELIVVNTCGFIDAAKKESLDAIVEAAQRKGDGVCQTVVAVGCMVERHKAEMQAALPEVDLFLGASETDRLIEELHARGLVGDPETIHPGVRLYTGDTPWVRYLKLSEGCDHTCAFCAIPLMRGKHRSFALDAVVQEAQLLELQGAREINLVAQDLAHYGRDRRDGIALPELLEALVQHTSVPWFRNLYLYSAGITPRLLEVVAREPRILPYLDMPIQHGSDAVLERMRRPERQKSMRERVQRFRDAVPDLTLRTTTIVGFPGETDEDFETLLAFLEEIRFDRVGCFTYSAQEGTFATRYADDVPDVVKRDRQERLLELQRQITAERYERHVGREVDVLMDRVDDDGRLVARAPWQADDIDGLVVLRGGVVAAADLLPGAMVRVRIGAVVDDYDFEAMPLRVVAKPPVTGDARRSRTLPVMAASGPGMISPFGR